jgi:4'-phosphopantetheinyl transferase
MLVYLAACHADSPYFDLANHKNLFSPERLEAVSKRPAADQRRTAAGQWLLKRLFEEHYPHIAFPPVFSYGRQDKPALAEFPDLGFNLSHSGAWAVCALCEAPVGVDIQQERPVREQLIRRFSAGEQALLNALSGQERQSALYDLWTLKEAYCKCTGNGLRTPLNATSFTLAPVTIDQRGFVPELVPFPESDYHLAVCVQTTEAIQVKLTVLS